MIRSAALLLLLAGALEAQVADVSPRFMRYGEPVEAATHTVRLGQNAGNAFGVAARLESGWQRATLWYSHTQAVSWPVGTERGPNPGPDATYDDLDLLGLTVGAGHRFGPVGVAGGAGGLAMMCQFSRCGSSPMFGWLVSADADVCLGQAEDIRVCLRGGVSAVPPRQGRWTWLADRADWDRPDDANHGDVWFTALHLGLSIGLTL